jgi:hypothetical protein
MSLDIRINALNLLGEDILSNISKREYTDIIEKSAQHNPWFTQKFITQNLLAIANNFLQRNNLEKWVSDYDFKDKKPKIVGLTLAGNIPLVGFQDVLCTFVSGNISLIKMSSKDNILLPFLLKKLTNFYPQFKDLFSFNNENDTLKNFDAVIATGSDNSARYFEYYFSKFPHIIRKNRTSIAIISDKTTDNDLVKLGEDVFSYFGLGCRNVSKVLVPQGFDITRIFDNWNSFEYVYDHFKYSNNYIYNKSIYLVNQEKFLDNGFAILKENPGLSSPIGVIFYEFYNQEADKENFIETYSDKIQIIVGEKNDKFETTEFGSSQNVHLWDYADNVDTMKFLVNI